MYGVTVLNTSISSRCDNSVFGAMLCLTILVGLITFGLFLVSNNSLNTPKDYLGLLPVFICFTLTVVCYFTMNTYNKYEVTINNDASFSEIEKRYIILDKRGEIYTIRERPSELER